MQIMWIIFLLIRIIVRLIFTNNLRIHSVYNYVTKGCESRESCCSFIAFIAFASMRHASIVATRFENKTDVHSRAKSFILKRGCL